MVRRLCLPSTNGKNTVECRNTTHEFSPESCLQANSIRDLDTEGSYEKLALLKDGPLYFRLSRPFPPFSFKLTQLPVQYTMHSVDVLPHEISPSFLLTYQNLRRLFHKEVERTTGSLRVASKRIERRMFSLLASFPMCDL